MGVMGGCLESMILLDGNEIPKRSILLYNDLRDSCFQFLDYFDEDGFEMLRSIIHSIDTNWFCEKCKCPIVDENHDSIACDYCYKWSHFKCVGISKFKANKLDKWFCNPCS
ncbi:hypothetical protein BpHYR1_029388 [Brachionus plicatilis]|uniref:PHD-type domain-containing protein n=1 Tax=Brachionus plicatilis TaxID=10195 RepID=A0A3M7Q4R6_BRAPC|nr:hypothetical protein BpHYR1_029388 [Brachionus plicatilis]